MKSYCLYCKTGSEGKLLSLLKKDMMELADIEVAILYPKKLVHEKHRGSWITVEQPLLPGYLFLYVPDEESLPAYIIREERDAYKMLRYSDGTIELQSSDAQYALWIYSHDGTIQPSTVVFREGQIVKVLDGPMKDMQGRIIKLDRHKKRVIVAFSFAGEQKRVNLSVNIIYADDQNPEL